MASRRFKLNSRYFEEFATHETFETLGRTITEADLVAYLGLARINTPIFADEEFAKKTRFGARIIPGPLVVAVSLGLVENLGLLGHNLIAMVSLSVEFTHALKVGDTVRVRTEVIEKEERSPDRGSLTLHDLVVNQAGSEIMKMTRKLLVRRRE